MRAISMERTSRTVIDATTSSRLSLSLTLLCRMSRIGTAGPPSCLGLGYEPALCCPALTLAASKHGLSMNYTTDFKPIRAEVSAEEWQARVDLLRLALALAPILPTALSIGLLLAAGPAS